MWKSRYSRTPTPAPVRFLTFAAVASAAMLAIAHGFQSFGHMEPCELCLQQRDGYWAALAVAVTGAAAARLRRTRARPIVLLLGVVFLAEAGLALYHAGVEWGWWPGPVACTGGHGSVSVADMSAFLKSAKTTIVQCDKAAWRWLGLSMAGWNALIALTLAVAGFVTGSRRSRR